LLGYLERLERLHRSILPRYPVRYAVLSVTDIVTVPGTHAPGTLLVLISTAGTVNASVALERSGASQSATERSLAP
jgi:hypothetical protein